MIGRDVKRNDMALRRLARIRKVADQHEQTRKDKKLKREALKRNSME
jgi:hypothetical protein